MNALDARPALGAELRYTLAPLDAESWHGILDGFQDASVFQTVPFCKVRSAQFEHLVVWKGDQVAAAAQIRLMPMRWAGRSVAYVLGGPLCHRSKHAPDWDNFRHALKRLRHEYVATRGGCLRVAPSWTADSEAECAPLFDAEGYVRAARLANRRTIVLDISRPLDEIRRRLDKKWRNCLNRAEANGLEIREGSDDAMFDVFLAVYREMLSRKRLAEPGDIRTFRAIQAALPARFKMNVIAAFDDGEPGAAAICSAIGRRGLFLFGATADRGMRNKASYLVQWRAIQWLKEMGCTEYDLHGSNPRSNPGVYAFKMGLCGKNGKEVELLGPYDACEGLVNRLALALGDRVNQQYKALKNAYGKLRGFRG